MILLAQVAAAADPSDAGSSAAAGAVGDVFVRASVDGARIGLDGVVTGIVTPGIVRGLAPGRHIVQVATECEMVEAEFTIDPGKIARLEPLVLVPGPGILSVETRALDGLELVVDGAATPLSDESKAEVSCAEHQVELRAPGFLPASATIKTPAYDTTVWTVELEPARFGSVVLDVIPLKTTVSVDGVALEPGPGTIEQLPVGPHQLLAQADGHLDELRTVEVVADEVTRVEFNLALDPGAPPPPRRRLGRPVVNAAVSVLGLGLGGYAVAEYVGARSAYGDFLTTTSDADADALYDAEVAPRARRAAVAGAAGGLAAVAAGGLWVTWAMPSGGAR